MKAKGSVKVSYLPETMWNEDEDGNKYIAVKEDNGMYGYLYANRKMIVGDGNGRRSEKAYDANADGTDIHSITSRNWNEFFEMIENIDKK